MHNRCVACENWLEWHRRKWRAASAQLVASWGIDSVTAVVTCAVGAVGELAACPTCSVVGRVLRWTSAADVRCLHLFVGRHARVGEGGVGLGGGGTVGESTRR